MPGSASDYLENKLLDHALGSNAFSKPANSHVALFTSIPSETGGGVEVTGGSYSRQIATFSLSANGSTSNNTNITFSNMPACTVNAVGIFDAASGGNMLFYSTLTVNRTVLAGDSVRINNGALVVTLT